jgi:predicted nucleotidyltransferase
MLKNLLAELARLIDANGIDYMIIGGQAVLMYGEPRMTRDIDITLALTPDELNKILNIVKNLDLEILVKDAESFVKKTWVLPCFHKESGLRIDFIFSWTPFEREAIGRTKIFDINGYPVRFATPEDVVIHKMLAGRAIDIEDIKSIAKKQRLDINYIKKWLKILSESVGKDLVKDFEKIMEEEHEL